MAKTLYPMLALVIASRLDDIQMEYEVDEVTAQQMLAEYLITDAAARDLVLAVGGGKEHPLI